MKKRFNIQTLCAFIFSFYICLSANAQQDPQYTQYMYNMNIVNPAYAGSYDALALHFLGRSQWAGIDGAPRTLTFNIHAPMGRSVGLGMSIIADKIGPLTETNIYADFSYNLTLSDYSNLAFGIKGGVTYMDAPLSLLQTVNPGDPAFAENLNKTLPNFGLGAYYYTDRFYASLSMPNILETVHFKRSNGAITKATDKMHIFLSSGYVFDLSSLVKLKPSFMVKAVFGAPVSIDLSSNFLIREKFEFGVSYRWGESLSGIVNVKVANNLRIGYAYDRTLSNLGTFNSGSHEVLVLFDFNFTKNVLKSPRFF